MPSGKKMAKMGSDAGCIYAMSGFLEAVAKVGKFSLRWDDDFYDRLSHRYTVIIMAIFTIMVCTKQYVGDPISCWCPATFTDPMIEYTNHICWISNTYFVPMEEMPGKHGYHRPRLWMSKIAILFFLLAMQLGMGTRRTEVVGYYQWIPLMLLLQAMLCFLPSVIWAINNTRPGLDINRLVLLVSGIEHINPDIREKSISFICRHFDRALAYQREYRRSRFRRCLQTMSKHFCLPIGRVYGNYLTTLYIFVKLLYISNAVGQVWLMNNFLSNDKYQFYFYGLEVMQAVFQNRQPNTRLFPRVTLCDFQIRQMQNVHDYTIQCTLPINLFNEKIYIYLWFHMCLIILLSTYGLLSLLWQLFSINCQAYITRYLKIMYKVNQSTAVLEVRTVRHFVNDYLRPDGVFALRVISNNTNDVIAAEIIGSLFEYYKKTGVYNMPHNTNYPDYTRVTNKLDLTSGCSMQDV